MKFSNLLTLALLLSATDALSIKRDHHKKDKKIDSEVDKILKEAEGIRDLQSSKNGESKSEAMSEAAAVVKELEKKEDRGRKEENIKAVIEEVKEENHKKEMKEAKR